MKHIYLHIFVATVAFGITGCLENMAADPNANAQNTNNQNINATVPQESTPTVMTPATVDPVAEPSLTPDPTIVDPVVPEQETPSPEASSPATTTPQVIVADNGDIYMVQGGDTILVQKADETEDEIPDYVQLSEPLPVGEAMAAPQLQLSDCKNEFWCGAKQSTTVDAGFGSTGWFFYTDESNDGDSYWSWPAKDWEGILSACNGICGMSTLGSGYLYPYMGFGFNLSENEEAVDITEWGGICVTYSTDTQMRIALHPNDDVQAEMEYNDYRVALKPGTNVTKDFKWSDFNQDRGWGVKYDRSLLLKQMVSIAFVYQDMGAGTVSSFNISKIGKLGTCK